MTNAAPAFLPLDFMEAHAFLQRLDPTATAFTFQTFDDNAKRRDENLVSIIHGTLEASWEKLARLNERGAGIFVTINCTDGKGRKIGNITRVRAVWAELDEGWPESLPLEPSMVVESSPERWHAYWFADGMSAEDHEGVMARLVSDHGSDPNAADLARVLRLPGFYNRKRTPHLVVVDEDTRRRFSRNETLRAFPPLPIARAAEPTRQKVNVAAVKSALEHVPADDRGVWLKVGQALKWQLGESGFDLWAEWSQRSEKYDPEDQARVWASIKREAADGKVTTAGTIFKLARENGWNGLQTDPAEEFEDLSVVLAELGLGGRKPKATGLVSRPASEIEPELIEWFWPNRFAIGKCSILAGEGGLGKTTVLLGIAATISRGGDWPVGEGRALCGSVLYFSTEDDAADTIVTRLMAAGADRSRVHIVSAVKRDDGKGNRAFHLQEDLLKLEHHIKAIADVRLAVFDPISAYFGRTDTYRNSEVRAVLEPLAEMAARNRVAIIGNTHFTKGGSGSANARILDSVAFTAQARSVYVVTEDPDDEEKRLFLPSKGNLGPPQKGIKFHIENVRVVPAKGIDGTRVVWEQGEVTVTADEAVAAISRRGEGPSLLDESVVFLQNFLADGPKPQKEIMDAGESQLLSKRTIRRAAKFLQIKATKMEMDGGWQWALPPLTAL